MMETGGYLGLELKAAKQYHENAIELNTARNAFEYILRSYNYSKVFLPYYTCEVLLEPLKKLGINYEFYSIDYNLEPLFTKKLNKNEVLVYNNYWGICDDVIKKIVENFKNIIIDNSQAFFSKPLNNIPTFYSARKFFGVPDGAYLYCIKKLNEDFEQDTSWQRMGHLFKRIDLNASDGYKDFQANEKNLSGQPIRLMSKLTKALLANIDYDYVANKRIMNFKYLNSSLESMNELKPVLDKFVVPMFYPFLIKSDTLKQELINNKIFIPTYWPMVKEIAPNGSWEEYLYKYLIPLPIDQRYGYNDIDYVLKIINDVIK